MHVSYYFSTTFVIPLTAALASLLITDSDRGRFEYRDPPQIFKFSYSSSADIISSTSLSDAASISTKDHLGRKVEALS